MDRHSSWSGARGAGGAGNGLAGRGRRVPPRAGQQRPQRRPPRAAAWDGASRWYWLALGVLGASLLLVPQLSHAQGLRSQPATVSLTVTAPPELRAPRTDANAAASTRRGPSVVDAVLTLPSASFELARIEVRAQPIEAPHADDAPQATRLFVRDGHGVLRDATSSWIVVADGATAAAVPVAVRAIARSGAPLHDATRWQLHYRLVPRDGALSPHEITRPLTIAPPR